MTAAPDFDKRYYIDGDPNDEESGVGVIEDPVSEIVETSPRIEDPPSWRGFFPSDFPEVLVADLESTKERLEQISDTDQPYIVLSEDDIRVVRTAIVVAQNMLENTKDGHWDNFIKIIRYTGIDLHEKCDFPPSWLYVDENAKDVYFNTKENRIEVPVNVFYICYWERLFVFCKLCIETGDTVWTHDLLTLLNYL